MTLEKFNSEPLHVFLDDNCLTSHPSHHHYFPSSFWIHPLCPVSAVTESYHVSCMIMKNLLISSLWFTFVSFSSFLHCTEETFCYLILCWKPFNISKYSSNKSVLHMAPSIIYLSPFSAASFYILHYFYSMSFLPQSFCILSPFAQNSCPLLTYSTLHCLCTPSSEVAFTEVVPWPTLCGPLFLCLHSSGFIPYVAFFSLQF